MQPRGQFSTHERGFPEATSSRRCNAEFETNTASIAFGRDVFDQCVAAWIVSRDGRGLASSSSRFGFGKKDPSVFAEKRAACLPFSYPTDLRRVLAPFLQ